MTKKSEISKKIKLSLILLLFLACSNAQDQKGKADKIDAAYDSYLFVYFSGTGEEQEAIRFAISQDGYRFFALNNNSPILSSAKISSTGGVRDPHVLRGQDGKTFYMVATDMMASNGWDSNRAMVLLKSTDLINWTSSVVNIPKRFPGQDSLLRVWAPQTIFDKKKGKYLIYWSMKYGSGPDKIYYAYANASFTNLESSPKQLLYNPGGGATIDGDILEKSNKYYLFFKTENAKIAGIKIAISDSLTSGYIVQENYVQQTDDPVEGSSTFKLNDDSGYILMYDVYTKGRYQFTKSKDLSHFTVKDNEVFMNFRPRHGTVIPITNKEADKLLRKWFSTDNLVGTASNLAINRDNIRLDTASRTLVLPVSPDTDLSNFDPKFMKFPGTIVLPSGAQDFTKGAVKYRLVTPGSLPKTYYVDVVINR